MTFVGGFGLGDGCLDFSDMKAVTVDVYLYTSYSHTQNKEQTLTKKTNVIIGTQQAVVKTETVVCGSLGNSTCLCTGVLVAGA